MRNVMVFVGLAFSAAAAFPAARDDQSVRASRGLAVWVAFGCNALAAQLNRTDDQRPLFDYGVEQGRQFIKDVQANRISKAAIDSVVPVGVLRSLEGPSADFMLGRVYAAAEENALRDIYKAGGQYLDAEGRSMRATNKFSDKNCDLVGR